MLSLFLKKVKTVALFRKESYNSFAIYFTSYYVGIKGSSKIRKSSQDQIIEPNSIPGLLYNLEVNHYNATGLISHQFSNTGENTQKFDLYTNFEYHSFYLKNYNDPSYNGNVFQIKEFGFKVNASRYPISLNFIGKNHPKVTDVTRLDYYFRSSFFENHPYPDIPSIPCMYMGALWENIVIEPGKSKVISFIVSKAENDIPFFNFKENLIKDFYTKDERIKIKGTIKILIIAINV